MPAREFKAGKAFWTVCLLILLNVLAYEFVELNRIKKCHQSEISFKRLVIDLAIRAYELDRGQHPKSLNALVPNYLEAVPVDPATGTKLTYPP